MNDPSLTALADALWGGLAEAHVFPRAIERAIAMRLPLTIVKVPVVNMREVRRRLGENGMAAPLPSEERDLMGFLLATRGQGTAVVCGADPLDEQRFTIAHEAAHFMLDYLRPRQRVSAALGPSACDVLDGRRPPTVAERAAALLARVRLGPHVHLLPRPGTDEADDLPIAWAESRADALALELVAPRERVYGLLRRHPRHAAISEDASARDAIAADMGFAFGLPAAAFRGLIRSAALAGKRSPALAAALAARRHRSPDA